VGTIYLAGASNVAILGGSGLTPVASDFAVTDRLSINSRLLLLGDGTYPNPAANNFLMVEGLENVTGINGNAKAIPKVKWGDIRAGTNIDISSSGTGLTVTNTQKVYNSLISFTKGDEVIGSFRLNQSNSQTIKLDGNDDEDGEDGGDGGDGGSGGGWSGDTVSMENLNEELRELLTVKTYSAFSFEFGDAGTYPHNIRFDKGKLIRVGKIAVFSFMIYLYDPTGYNTADNSLDIYLPDGVRALGWEGIGSQWSRISNRATNVGSSSFIQNQQLLLSFKDDRTVNVHYQAQSVTGAGVIDIWVPINITFAIE